MVIIAPARIVRAKLLLVRSLADGHLRALRRAVAHAAIIPAGMPGRLISALITRLARLWASSRAPVDTIALDGVTCACWPLGAQLIRAQQKKPAGGHDSRMLVQMLVARRTGSPTIISGAEVGKVVPDECSLTVAKRQNSH